MSAVYAIPAYPKELTLRDGSTVTVRALQSADDGRLLDFFLGNSDEERYFLKNDVTAPAVVRNWTEHLDFDRARLPGWSDGVRAGPAGRDAIPVLSTPDRDRVAPAHQQRTSVGRSDACRLRGLAGALGHERWRRWRARRRPRGPLW